MRLSRLEIDSLRSKGILAPSATLISQKAKKLWTTATNQDILEEYYIVPVTLLKGRSDTGPSEVGPPIPATLSEPVSITGEETIPHTRFIQHMKDQGVGLVLRNEKQRLLLLLEGNQFYPFTSMHSTEECYDILSTVNLEELVAMHWVDFMDELNEPGWEVLWKLKT